MTRKDERIIALEGEIARLKIEARQAYANSPTQHQMKIATIKDLLKRGNTLDAFYITVAARAAKLSSPICLSATSSVKQR